MSVHTSLAYPTTVAHAGLKSRFLAPSPPGPFYLAGAATSVQAHAGHVGIARAVLLSYAATVRHQASRSSGPKHSRIHVGRREGKEGTRGIVLINELSQKVSCISWASFQPCRLFEMHAV